MRSLIDPRIRSWRLGATVFTAFGGLALLIAVVGLYSVLSFSVAQRTHKLGIRAALGAGRGRLIALVLRQAAILVGSGLAIGLVVATVAAGKIEPLLFQVSPHDAAVLIAVVGTLAVTGLLAALLPARRATAVSPIETLRAE